jgi:hypothetical protein
MAQYLSFDRRQKPEGEHLQNVVKVRFTDGELEQLQAAAADILLEQCLGQIEGQLYALRQQGHRTPQLHLVEGGRS